METATMPKVLANVTSVRDPRKSVIDGIVGSAGLTYLQREAVMDGVVHLNHKSQDPKFRVEPPKTLREIGVVHYQGTR